MLRSALGKVSRQFVRCESTGSDFYVRPRMEKSLNKVTLLGRVGQDPIERGFDSERAVVQFTLATSEIFKDKRIGHEDEYKEKTMWHRISVFTPYLRNLITRAVTKGSRVYVTGKLDYSEYMDKQGHKVFSTSIIADDVIFLSTRRESQRDRQADDDEDDSDEDEHKTM
ncbi:single-stranded DNA-binding protein, mitochondrial-like [Glandiceps talaboti]